MKKISLIIFTFCLVLAAAFGFAACGEGDKRDPSVIPVVSVGLDKTSLELEVGDTYILNATVLPSNATDKTRLWKSSDEAVATADGGKVTAIAEGSATVTVIAGGKEAACTVKVIAKTVVPEETVHVANVSLNRNELSLSVGGAYNLVATVLPANATDRTVVWKSSDEAVATVDGGKITAKSVGTAMVTATADGKSAACKITVSEKVIAVEEITLDVQNTELEVGDTKTLTATVLPANATDKTVVWKSSDEAVATVDGGKITARSAGNAIITATAGGKEAACRIKVSAKTVPAIKITLNKTDLELEEGETFLLTATVFPSDATENEVIWSSSDENTATVKEGLVTAKAVGTAIITAKIGNLWEVCEVGVIAREEDPDPTLPDDGIITYAHAGEESAAFEWKDADAAVAKVEYKLSSAVKYTSVDKQLIRQISASVARADILGLKGGEKYDFKIISADGKVAYAREVGISAYDRSGYAHHNYTGGVGAYNDDGTLKAGATVIYVTEDNKNNVDGKGNSIAEYLAAAKNNKNPVAVRIIGTVGSATWNEIEYNAKGHEGDDITEDKVVGINGKKLPTDNSLLTQAALIGGGYNKLNEYPEKLGGAKCVAIDGLVSKAKYSSGEYDSAWNDCQVQGVNNVTIEGVGEDAEIFQWGFTFKSCNSVEVRNLRFYDYTEDACSVEGSENSETLSGFKHKNFWIHHNVFDLGVNYWDICPEQDKHDGDGATDFKYIAYVTVAYNRYNYTHKTGLVGGGDTAHQACFTFHHNFYNGCDQRMPLGRQANMHMYNNYYFSSGLYSISLRAGAYAFIENCVFTSGKSSTVPIELRSGSNGTPSCKVVNCKTEGKISNAVGSENLYVGNDVKATVSGGNLYGQNFELGKDFYTVTDMLKTDEVATEIPKLAGVMKRSLNIEIDGDTEEEKPPVTPDPPVTPTDGQSLSYTSAGDTVAVNDTISDGDLFTAVWNEKAASVMQGLSAAVADDNPDKSFGYALVSGGTGGGVTVTANKAITLRIYYGATDSKFTTDKQSKDGNLSWTIDGGTAVNSQKTSGKSNEVAYSETITLEEGQTVVITISKNRFVLYGLFAE